jgi:hypothetical protein
MGADERVRQDLPRAATAPAVLREGLRRQEQRGSGYLAQFQCHREHHGVECFDGRERQRHLGVDVRLDC